jgi:hypothetical protein
MPRAIGRAATPLPSRGGVTSWRSVQFFDHGLPWDGLGTFDLAPGLQF